MPDSLLHLHQTEVLNTSYHSFEPSYSKCSQQPGLQYYQKHVIIGISLLTTLVSFKPKVIFWMSLVDFTAFRFTTNSACLLFVDSIRGLLKFSPITVSQFLQYFHNYYTSFIHNPFLSVIETLTHFLNKLYKLFILKNYERKLV